nr:TPA_asm: RNA-dependent polymerase [Antaeus toti-like virus 1]
MMQSWTILNRAETRWVLEKMGRDDIRFECYQGDDAIVVLGGSIEKKEVARIYKQLGLEVHPEKTWVTKGNTEYLHEVYVEGKVLAFPARAFRAVAWKKPLGNILSSEYGWDKFQALMGVMRMAMRRGLQVQDMVKRALRQYGVKGSGFEEWWMTPYVFGGFGAGTYGRMELRGKTKIDDSVNFRIHVSGIEHLDDIWKQAAASRAEGSMPLPGRSLELRWLKVSGSDVMDPLEAADLLTKPQVKVDWTLADLETNKFAYRRKLELEWKYRTGEKIFASDLPRFFGYTKNIDTAYRKYRRVIGEALGLDGTQTASESHFRVSLWANSVWSGMCYRHVRIGWDLSVLPLLRSMHRTLTSSAYKRVILVMEI